MILVSISKYCNDYKYWYYSGGHHYMSGHCYRGSAFETDDTCANCNGANCDICKKVHVDGHFESAIVCTDLEEMLAKEGLDKDTVTTLVYSDTVRCYNGYMIKWPTAEDLKNDHPELYNSLINPPEDMLNTINKVFDSKDYKFRFEAEEKAIEMLAGKYDKNHVKLVLDRMLDNK